MQPYNYGVIKYITQQTGYSTLAEPGAFAYRNTETVIKFLSTLYLKGDVVLVGCHCSVGVLQVF